MLDVREQLRGYGEQLDALMTAMDVDGHVIRPDGVETMVDSPVRELSIQVQEADRHRRWPVAVAAAFAVLLLVGGLPWFFRVTEPDSPVADTVVSTTLIETPPTTVAESALTNLGWCEAPSTWTRVCDDAAGFEGATMSSVTAGGPGYVAVGAAGGFSDGSERPLAVWTSSDGFTWTRVPHDESVFGGVVDTDMSGVTAGGPGLVAVGSDGGDAAVWTSPDGFTWTRVPHDESVFGGDLEQRMASVTVGGPGLVAVGSDGTRDDANDVEGVAAVWTSPDGLTWTRVPHDESVFGGNGQQMMSSVTVGGPGLVAVGWDGIGAGNLLSCCEFLSEKADADAAVWTSPDGLTWSRVPHDEAVFGGDTAQAMLSVTVGGPGLVAVGADGDHESAAVWTSPDGFNWSRVAYDPVAFGGSAFDQFAGDKDWMASVSAVGAGLVAVGSSAQPLWEFEEAMWTSPDGITWTRLPRSQHGCWAEMWGVTDGPSGLVAVGFAQDCGPDIAAVWHD